jgi:hypothetical protein
VSDGQPAYQLAEFLFIAQAAAPAVLSQKHFDVHPLLFCFVSIGGQLNFMTHIKQDAPRLPLLIFPPAVSLEQL